jgi:hypothetical protein
VRHHFPKEDEGNMPGVEANPASRHQDDPRESADRILGKMLRQIGVDILDEPVPEKLRQVLRPHGAAPSRDDRTQRRDDEPSG